LILETSSSGVSHGLNIPGKPEDPMAADVFWRSMRSLTFSVLLLAVIMFVPAGIGWTKGWIFLVVFLLQTALAVVYLWHRNPAIFAARSKIQKGIKRWDKVLMFFLFLSLLAVFPVAGLDDGRFHWLADIRGGQRLADGWDDSGIFEFGETDHGLTPEYLDLGPSTVPPVLPEVRVCPNRSAIPIQRSPSLALRYRRLWTVQRVRRWHMDRHVRSV